MGFIESLRTHLEGLPTTNRSVDSAPYRGHLLRRLREIETTDPRRAEDLQRFWSPTSVETFVKAVQREVVATGLASSPDETRLLVMTAMDMHLGCAPAVASTVTTRELREITDRALDLADLSDDDWGDLERYAREIGLMRAAAESKLTRAGRVFLSLRGRDAVAWLLVLEMSHTWPASDVAPLSRDLALLLLERGSWPAHLGASDRPPARFSRSEGG